MYQREDEMEIDLGKLLHYYWQNWKALIASGLVGVLAALLVTALFITPKYRASVTVYVNNMSSTQSMEAITGTNLSAAQQLVNTYVNIIKSDTVLEEVIQKGHLDCTADDIREMMMAKQVNKTEMFTVTISHPDAEMAAKIVNSIAHVAPARISNFVKGSSTEIIDYAKVPNEPYSPSYPKNIVMGGLLGLILVSIVLTFRFLFDMRIQTEEDVASYLRVPVLGTIPEHAPEEKKNVKHMAALNKGGQR